MRQILKNGPLARVGRWLIPGESLSQRAAYGIAWSFALKIVDRLLGLARTMALARVLGPEDFGLFGIALLVVSMLELFSHTGFQTALIQKKDVIDSYLDTAWTAHLIRGAVLASLLFGLSPLIAVFFEEPRIVWLLRGISLSVLLGGFGNIGLVYFQKELAFHKTFIYAVGGTIADAGVALLAAFLLRDTWALVLGLLARRLFQLFLSYTLHPYRPRLVLAREQLAELFSFGKWSLLSNILHFAYTQGDDLFVGKLLGTVTLGLYQMAYRISRMVSTEFAAVIQQITVPAFSKLQDDAVRLRQAYLQTQKLLSYVSAPFAAGVAVIAPDFVPLFLGEDWLPMIPALQILSLAGFVAGINSNFGPLVVAKGRPDLGTRANVVRLGILALLIYPASQLWGLFGIALLISTVTLAMAPFTFFWAVRFAGVNIQRMLFETAVPAVMAAMMVLAVSLLRHFLAPVGFVGFGVLIFAGVITYLALTVFVDKVLHYEILSLFQTYLGKVLPPAKR